MRSRIGFQLSFVTVVAELHNVKCHNRGETEQSLLIGRRLVKQGPAEVDTLSTRDTHRMEGVPPPNPDSLKTSVGECVQPIGAS